MRRRLHHARHGRRAERYDARHGHRLAIRPCRQLALWRGTCAGTDDRGLRHSCRHRTPVAHARRSDGRRKRRQGTCQ